MKINPGPYNHIVMMLPAAGSAAAMHHAPAVLRTGPVHLHNNGCSHDALAYRGAPVLRRVSVV